MLNCDNAVHCRQLAVSSKPQLSVMDACIVFRLYIYKMCHVMRIPVFCICESKGADQLGTNYAADQRFCFRYIDSAIPLPSKSALLLSLHR